jgi:hypothetical protein
MSTHPEPASFDHASVGAVPVVPQTLPATLETPEPPDPGRHDGWTPVRQAAFLRELAATHNVAAAARMVGMSRQSAYKLRTRLRDASFGAAWEAAFQTRFDVLAEAALERALNGVEVAHYYNGELVGTSRRYDERLTLALLAMRHDLARRRPTVGDPASVFEHDDLAGLIERVEQGPEAWHDDSEQEWAARYGADEEE